MPDPTYHPGMSTYFTDKANRLIGFICESNDLQLGRDNDKIAHLLSMRRNYDVCFREAPHGSSDTVEAEYDAVLATALTVVK